jgi:hypothetical protein
LKFAALQASLPENAWSKIMDISDIFGQGIDAYGANSHGMTAHIPPRATDLHQDWKAHGIQAIRRVRETRPSDYLKIVAMIVSKAEDLSSDSEIRDAAVEQIIEERRQKALLQIAKMRGES